MLDIITYGDPVLRKKAEPVVKFDKELKKFVENLTQTMVTRDGVGLAAPQVAQSVRIIVLNPDGENSRPIALVNPEIIFSSKKHEANEEGCLSLPGFTLKVTRPAAVSVKGRSVDNKELLLENVEGLLCRALQHEIDHLDGIMIIDRISPLQRQLLSSKLKKLAKTGRV